MFVMSHILEHLSQKIQARPIIQQSCRQTQIPLIRVASLRFKLTELDFDESVWKHGCAVVCFTDWSALKMATVPVLPAPSGMIDRAADLHDPGALVSIIHVTDIRDKIEHNLHFFIIPCKRRNLVEATSDEYPIFWFLTFIDAGHRKR